MMRILALALMAVAPLPALVSDEAIGTELALPPLTTSGPGFVPERKVPVGYGERPGDAKLREAVVEGQVLLWASSPEVPPPALKVAVAAMRKKYGIPAGLVRTGFTAPKSSAAKVVEVYKEAILKINRDVARLQAVMEDQVLELQSLAEARDKESPRWQAHHDLITACLLCRLAHLDEYGIQLGEMRKEFPERDPAKHRGWRLETTDGMRDVPAKRRVKAAKKLFQQLIDDHPGTPWSAAARQWIEAPLSVEWKAQ